MALARERQREDFNARITQSWYGEMFARTKRLKPVKSYWWKAEIRPQSRDELRSTLHLLAKQYGGAVRTVS